MNELSVAQKIYDHFINNPKLIPSFHNHIDSLNNEDKLEILFLSIINHHDELVRKMDEQIVLDVEFFNYICNTIYDTHNLIKAYINYHCYEFYGFKLILIVCQSKLPLTINKLFKIAKTKHYLLFHFAEIFNKKEMLKALVKRNDKKNIDRFFTLYKHDPEVRAYVPFL